MTPFKHKGYIGIPHVEADDDVIAGVILGIATIVTFEGDTVPEARKAFEDSVDDYLAWCQERGEEPEKPFAGKVELRLPREVHRAVALAADAERTNVADYIGRKLRRALEAEGQIAPEVVPLGPTYGEQKRRGEPEAPAQPLYGHPMETAKPRKRKGRAG